MIDRLQHHQYRVEQAIFLGITGLVLLAFGFAVVAQQYRRGVRPTWPLPGGLVGAAFLIDVSLLPLMMSAVRFGWLGWTALSWQQTSVYLVISVCALMTLIRWWRFGFDDDHAWNGEERRQGERRQWWQSGPIDA